MTTNAYYKQYFELIEKRSALIDLKGETETPLPEVERPIDWHKLFGNENPVEIENGCGKGRFILESAKRHPETNYIGIERARKYANRTKERLVKHIGHIARLLGEEKSPSFSNLRLVWSDAPYFVDRHVADDSVQAYHVYFPDPWPKKRNKKRRLFRSEVWLHGLIRTLNPNGGRLYVATDYAEYFYEIHYRLRQLTPLVYMPSGSVVVEHIPTNFEMKYIAEGRKIYRAVYERRESEK